MSTLLEDLQSVGELAETNLKAKGVDCDFGKASESKDTLYDLADKIEDIEQIDWYDAALLEWDASKQNPFETNCAAIHIGTGGGYINYGDGTIEKLTEGSKSFNHTYTDDTKTYEIRITNVDYITAISNNLFENAVGLLTASFPKVTTINDHTNDNTNYNRTFKGCSNLTKVSFKSLIRIRSASGWYNAYNECFMNCVSLVDVDMPNLTTIDAWTWGTLVGYNRCFSGCTSLKTINLPSYTTVNMTKTDGYGCMNDTIFSGCTSLEQINLPSLKNVYIASSSSWNAFEGSSLKDINLGSFAISQGGANHAFRGINLRIIRFTNTTPQSITNSDCFSSCSGTIVIVPSGCKTAYESAANYPNPSTNTYVECNS